jgi:hypothetical protein
MRPLHRNEALRSARRRRFLYATLSGVLAIAVLAVLWVLPTSTAIAASRAEGGAPRTQPRVGGGSIGLRWARVAAEAKDAAARATDVAAIALPDRRRPVSERDMADETDVAATTQQTEVQPPPIDPRTPVSSEFVAQKIAELKQQQHDLEALTAPPAPPPQPIIPDVVVNGDALLAGRAKLTVVCHFRPAPLPPSLPPRVDLDSGQLYAQPQPTWPEELAWIVSPMYMDDTAAAAYVASDQARSWNVTPGDACLRVIQHRASRALATLKSLPSQHAGRVSRYAPDEGPYAIVPTTFRKGFYLRPFQRHWAVNEASPPRSEAEVAGCLDPRFPVRLPLMLVPFGAVEDEVMVGRRRPVPAHFTSPADAATIAQPPVLPCYGSSDVVCDTLRTSGFWERDLVGIVHEALQGIVAERFRRFEVYVRAVAAATVGAGEADKAMQAAMFALHEFANRGQPAAVMAGDAPGWRSSFGVEYMDVGANVGAFATHFRRLGYPVTAFEALPYNMQLLSVNMCLNGFRKARIATTTSEENQSGDVPPALESAAGSGPPFRVHNNALGSEADRRCVMLSEDQNFGDTWISCNETIVKSTDEFPFERYRKRGYVTMTTMDAVVLRPHRSGGLRREADDRAAALDAALRAFGVGTPMSQQKLEEVEIALLKEYERLPDDFLAVDYVAKLDVEGHETEVLEGAAKLLDDEKLRPRVVLTEVWLSLNATKLATMMLSRGYVGWSLAFRVRINRLAILRGYNRMRAGQDNIIWVEERWEGILMPRMLQPAAAAAQSKGGGNRLDQPVFAGAAGYRPRP